VTAKIGFSPKSGSERSVPLNSVLVEALKEHGKALTKARSTDWVFQRNPSSGSQWPASALCAAVRTVFKAADLYDRTRKIGLHMLRRSFCSHSLSRGASIEAVRAMGGWSSLAVIQRYAVSVEDEQRRAVERLVELAE
jgi:site-specific recombinase XerD